MTLTMRQIETEAREYIRDLYRKHGITRRVPSARLGEGLSARARANVDQWLNSKCRRCGLAGPRFRTQTSGPHGLPATGGQS